MNSSTHFSIFFFFFTSAFCKKGHWTHCITLSGQTLYTTGFRLQILQNHALLYSCWIIFMRLYLIFTVIWTRNGCTLTSRMLNSYRWPFQRCVHHSHITTVSSLLPTTPESCAVWKSWQMFTLWLTFNSTHWISFQHLWQEIIWTAAHSFMLSYYRIALPCDFPNVTQIILQEI